MPVAHGGHFYRMEGGGAIAHMVLLDVVVNRGRLGPGGLRSFLTRLSWADDRVSPAWYRRPLYEWSWSLREQREMWSWPRAKRWTHPIKWSRKGARIELGAGSATKPPHVPGFRLDCVGISQRPTSGSREVRLYYRPVCGQVPLVACYCNATDVPPARTGRIYRIHRTRLDGHKSVAIRTASVGSSRVDVDLGEAHLVVMVPSVTTRERPDQDLRMAARFVREITGLE